MKLIAGDREGFLHIWDFDPPANINTKNESLCNIQ